jgi:hypothetical protein
MESRKKRLMSAINSGELPCHMNNLLQAKELRPRGPKRIAREIRESKLAVVASLAQLRGITIHSATQMAGL